MELNLSLIIWSAVLTPILYGFYCFSLYVLDVRKRGQAIDKFPADPKHWLWGHIHLVGIQNLKSNSFDDF